MPVYEYACTSCGERTEARQGFDDPPLEKCSFCGGKLRKLYSPVGIVFKGSGFYATDARKSAGKAASKSDGAQADKPAEKPVEKSSGKPGSKDTES